MIRWFADENLNGAIVRSLFYHRPSLDLVRVQDVGLRTADDVAVLEWAATHGRILLTQDRATMPDFAFRRVVTHQPMPGIFVVDERVSLRQVIDEILLVEDCSTPDEWHGKVIYLPL